jgi:hypothetical protein
MTGHGEKLTRKQDALIAALLTAASIREAAQQVGIGEKTAWRWLKDVAFQAAYRDTRRAVVQHAIVQVQRATGTAVTTLLEVMQDVNAPASAKVSAAKAVLEMAVKAVELEDVEARLVALEASMQERRPG